MLALQMHQNWQQAIPLGTLGTDPSGWSGAAMVFSCLPLHHLGRYDRDYVQPRGKLFESFNKAALMPINVLRIWCSLRHQHQMQHCRVPPLRWTPADAGQLPSWTAPWKPTCPATS